MYKDKLAIPHTFSLKTAVWHVKVKSIKKLQESEIAPPASIPCRQQPCGHAMVPAPRRSNTIQEK
jgi:hypothetical protein